MRALGRTLLEAGGYAASALASGLLANAVHPRGIEMARVYWPHWPPFVTAIDAVELAELLPLAGDPDSGIVILDARREEDWQAGRIPGALCADPRALERHLTPELAERLRRAVWVVVYCNGGECEDSVELAGLLTSPPWSVDGSLVRIYEGGIEEWRRKGMPLEP